MNESKYPVDGTPEDRRKWMEDQGCTCISTGMYSKSIPITGPIDPVAVFQNIKNILLEEESLNTKLIEFCDKQIEKFKKRENREG